MNEIATAASGINPFVAGGIGVGTSLINSMFQGIANRRQNKRMVDFWNMNNAYNHPSAQMARLREAGLNPALMYGQGTTGNAPGFPRPEKEFQAEIGNPLADIQNTRIQNLQADNLRAQNTVLQNDAIKKASESAKILADTRWLSETNKEKLKRAASEANIAMFEANFRRQQWELQHIVPEDMDKFRSKAQQDMLIRYSRNAEDLSNAEKLGRLRDAEQELKNRNIDFYEANAIMNLLTKFLGIPFFKNR